MHGELAQVIAALRTGGVDFAMETEKARVQFDTALSNLPVANDLMFSDTQLGGIPGIMVESPGINARAALLYLHGGAFIAGSAIGYRGLAGELGRATGVTAYVPDYRLAPESPFPAAVEDCCAAYRGLLARGFAPDRVVIAGDSAGGGLVLSTLLALREEGLRMPVAAVAISPWVDLVCSAPSYAENSEYDASLTADGLRHSASRYLAEADPRQPLASPVYANLAGLPPLLIQVGSTEILLSDSMKLAAAAECADVPVKLEVWPNMPHVWHAFAFMLDSGRQAIGHAGEFLTRALAG